MQFDGVDIGGKEVGAASIEIIGNHFFGAPYVGEGRALLGALKQQMGVNIKLTFAQNSLEHEPEFYVATAYDALMVGALDGSMDIAKAKQTEVTIKYQVSTYVSSIKGAEGSADIDAIRITVVTEATLKPLSDGDSNACIGFTVQLTRTSHLDELLRCALYTLEPALDKANKDPVLYDYTGWITNFGGPRLFVGTDPGFVDHGFGRIEADLSKPLDTGIALYLDYAIRDTVYVWPEHGPRIATYHIGSVRPDDTQHLLWNSWAESNTDFAQVVGGSPFTITDVHRANYAANIDIVHAHIVAGQFWANSQIASGNGGIAYITSTPNYLMVFQTKVERDKKDFNFPPRPWLETTSPLNADRQHWMKHPYSTVALLPPKSTVRSSNPYDFASDPEFGSWTQTTIEGGDPDPDTGYTYFGLYQNIFQQVLDAGVEMPYEIGGLSGGTNDSWGPTYLSDAYQHTLFPHGLISFDDTFIDYTLTVAPAFTQTQSIGEPPTKAIAGEYEIRVPTWRYLGSLGDAAPTAGWESITGVAYELDIELFLQDGVILKKNLKGVSGKEHDKLQIKVKHQVETTEDYEAYTADNYINIIR